MNLTNNCQFINSFCQFKLYIEIETSKTSFVNIFSSNSSTLQPDKILCYTVYCAFRMCGVLKGLCIGETNIPMSHIISLASGTCSNSTNTCQQCKYKSVSKK